MRWNRLWAAACGLVATLALAGCSFAHLSVRDPIGADAAVDGGSGYLYGSFQLDSDFLNLTKLLVRVEDDRGGTFEIPLTSDPIAAYAVVPGTYHVKEFLFTPGGPASMLLEREVSRIPLPASVGYLANPVRVEAGRAYYLADFLGTTRRDLGVLAARFKGSFVGITQNFDATTQALRSKVPGLAGVEAHPAFAGAGAAQPTGP